MMPPPLREAAPATRADLVGDVLAIIAGVLSGFIVAGLLYALTPDPEAPPTCATMEACEAVK